ncbi:MAG: exo-alpha-sialidase [Clostridia bacterium]|nr:exo-alpha-sialidase [Clostridia bacterium]
MRKIRLALLMVFALTLCASVCAADIEVITYVSDETTVLSAVDTGTDALFCGWFTSEAAAKSLDTSLAATDGYDGTLYGAVLPIDGGIELVGVQMRTAEPNGIRFLTKIDKDIISTVESLNALNRKGKNGTFTPANETLTGIGYGTVLAIDVDTDSELVKTYGTNVKDGMCVPGVYTFEEDDTSVTYTATVVGVDTASLADKIAARPYITYADANGNEHTVYYSESGRANSAYAASVYGVATLVAADEDASETDVAAANSLLTAYAGSGYTTKSTIESFNLSSVEGSADNDNAYVELDRTTLVALDENNHYRYQNAFYPRITKVSEDLYLMTFNYQQTGQHLYYTTSTDGITWGDPKVLYSSSATANSNTYTYGSLSGTTDQFFAATADHCVLDDGTILCVYSRRAVKGYASNEYTGLHTLELIRGTVSGTDIKWSTPTSIYHGHTWEPEILQRKNGDIEIYWSHAAPMIDIYGFDVDMRSSGVAMISSSDGGYTWTPNVTAGDTNHYAGKRIYQYSAGKFTLDSGKTVNFYHGQMPGVVELTNGKMMVVAETRTTTRSYHMISAAYSNAKGVWTELGIDEAGPSNVKEDNFRGAAPTLMRFDSGELLLTYNYNSMMYARLLNKTGSDIADAYPSNVFYCTTDDDGGFWSASAPVDSHTAILAMSHKRYNGAAPETTTDENGEEVTTLHNTTVIGKVRLNHTIDAANKNMVADGNLQEWKNITDALFVGSQTSVQATYRFAYDEDYIYVAIDRTDSFNSKEDTNYVMVATSDGYIKAEISYGDYTLPTGVTGGTKNAAGGRVYELAFDRDVLGLTGDYIRVCPGFTDASTGVDDRINGTYISDTSTWIKINLE